MLTEAQWICAGNRFGNACPVFRKNISLNGKINQAKLFISALGVYEARINEKRIGKFVMAPGWTVYEKRVQYQQYDILPLLEQDNEICVILGKGWFSSNMPGWVESEDRKRRAARQNAIIAEIQLEYEDGRKERIFTDSSWECAESKVKFSEIYDGESYDASYNIATWYPAEIFPWTKDTLIPQEGELVCEQERIEACEIIKTPKGEILIDFGQEITGYVEFTLNAKKGDRIRILHGEILDQNGNFYNENYRSAKAEINYICQEGTQTWHPVLTFFGFRYIKLEEFPGRVEKNQFSAIAVYSDIRRTGWFQCGVPEVNQLFSNIIWGQKDNFLDVPTDCPQRDERLGWTGDAQVFIKTASYNYKVDKFFMKWLHDLAACQRNDGGVGQVIPDYLPDGKPSAAWGDAAVICPWQVYLTYGNLDILKEQFDSMKRWVDYITSSTTTPYLWTGGEHFGDWLGLDARPGSYKGVSREDLIATAFYAYSTELLIKTGKILNRDMNDYESLYKKIVDAFRKQFPEYKTQTECVLAVRFRLAENLQAVADSLADMIKSGGDRITTGFVGTPYILHVLCEYGYAELAYTLFLRKTYPSWLYSIGKGATTVWEHWDGIMENGDLWSADMNSFNHYAYGSVADWMYEKCAGICLLEEAPGFERVRIAPVTDERMRWLEASLETKKGKIVSKWNYIDEQQIRYEISTPVPAEIILNGKKHQVCPGSYVFWKKKEK